MPHRIDLGERLKSTDNPHTISKSINFELQHKKTSQWVQLSFNQEDKENCIQVKYYSDVQINTRHPATDIDLS